MPVDNPHRLTAVGPRSADHGYPLWYEDENGVRLELGLRPDPLTPAIGDIPTPGSPLSIPDNFPDESFYYMAEARLPVGGAGQVGRARLILALEAAFGGAGSPDPTARVVFARIRVRMDDLIPGASYVVTHPYGVTDALVADDRGRVAWTDDRGIADEVFDTVLATGRVAPFLQWASGAPEGYLGDGATERPVTGSPFGTNFFRIDGPQISQGGGTPDPADPTNPNRVQTDLFTVQGRLATQLGVDIDRAVYHHDGTNVRLVVHARSVPNQTLELRDPHVVLGAQDRAYSAHVSTPTVPTAIEVLNTSDQPRTTATTTVTDQVVVDAAVWDTTAQTLTVTARSSDTTGAAVLTVEGFGNLVNGSETFPAAATPADIMVSSSAGGHGTRAVETVGTTATILPPLPPEPAPPPEPTPPVPVITIDRCQYRTDRQQLRVAGTCTGGLPPQVTASLADVEIGSSAVDATGSWDIRRTFTATEAELVPTAGDTVHVTTAHGGTAEAPVSLTN